jgi:uncharacterized metal-binding protein YceD (DUF177 family)
VVGPNEFSHIIKLDEIGAGATKVSLSADPEARRGLIARFDLVALDRLDADLEISRDAKGVLAQGRIRATLSQHCVATGDAVPADLDEAMVIRFITEPVVGKDAEIELGADDCDTMFHDGMGVDLGEAVAQSLGLALDPYPRSPDAQKHLKAAGVKAEDEVEPVGALAGLKDLLAKK